MKQITSASNERIRKVRRLEQAKVRREEGAFLAEGPHLVEEALRAGFPLREVYLRDDCDSELAQEACRMARQAFSLSAGAFRALSQTSTPQGIVAVVEGRAQPFAPEKAQGTLLVALDGVQDPGNVGTVLRTAAAVGACGVLLGPGCADPLGAKAVRASMGAVFKLPLWESADLAANIAALTQAGWHTLCGHLHGKNFFERASFAKAALVIGSEGAGVSAEVARACAGLYRLPMENQTESLNAAVAAGVMLYDLWREQKGGQ
ncbi:MAG: RNA methyltransferase [Eubacteriales bacterium]|nr:RNA methyltransferase [Eubacteriales bacterium]